MTDTTTPGNARIIIDGSTIPESFDSSDPTSVLRALRDDAVRQLKGTRRELELAENRAITLRATATSLEETVDRYNAALAFLLGTAVTIVGDASEAAAA
ncbi:hypothetical protein BKA24_001752 [Microbacterium marinum]|uniref:Uncharacterized protein n=1 Tax=Microbacterium marinum TaxID=421115 RepID=A0A7W7FJD4_9MICO|nr:hypothetical protein [Microbacterium marinum]MBB4667043.1 hypothetical protein [Microbacterium marinum]